MIALVCFSSSANRMECKSHWKIFLDTLTTDIHRGVHLMFCDVEVQVVVIGSV